MIGLTHRNLSKENTKLQTGKDTGRSAPAKQAENWSFAESLKKGYEGKLYKSNVVKGIYIISKLDKIFI
jgi:hypothetical protein